MKPPLFARQHRLHCFVRLGFLLLARQHTKVAVDSDFEQDLSTDDEDDLGNLPSINQADTHKPIGCSTIFSGVTMKTKKAYPPLSEQGKLALKKAMNDAAKRRKRRRRLTRMTDQMWLDRITI